MNEHSLIKQKVCMARPRLTSDKKIIAEAYELIMERGLDSLTFEKLGKRVGLVPAALVRRFKNKQQLLLHVDRYGLERTDEKMKEAVAASASAVDVIIAQFTAELAFASTIERFANGQGFLLMDFQDKGLYDNYQVSFIRRHEQVVDLLEKAQADGELQGISDSSALARHLEMILHGSGHVWAMTQEGAIDEYIRYHVEFALEPYRRGGRM